MTLKMFELIDFPSVFQNLKSQKLSFKTAYRLTLLSQEIQKHVDFYHESFRAILVEYGKKDEQGKIIPTEDGQGVLLEEATLDEAYQKLTELRELEVELPDTKFCLKDFDNIEITAEEMLIIIPFIGE